MTSDATLDPDRQRYLLICNTADGLIAQVNGVVVQLQLARRLGLVPIVELRRRSYMFGADNPYFEAARGPNVWEYYFEPISVPTDELARLVGAGQVITLSTPAELSRLFRWEPASWVMNPYGYFRSVENRADGAYPAAWWAAQRDKARVFLDDGTVRFRPAILDQVSRFAAREFAGHTLGLQLRGSDKFDFGVGPNLSRQVTPDEYYPHIDRYLVEHPDCTRIFVATDQRQWLKLLEAAYPGRIISFSEKSLSDDAGNSFHAVHEKGARGAEVLIDALLLARCRHLIKCHAGVGEMALVLNPRLTFVDLNYDTQPFVARKRAAHAMLAPIIAAIRLAWQTLAERGLAFARVESIDGAEIVVSGGRSLDTKTDAKLKADRPPLSSPRFVSSLFSRTLRELGERCVRYAQRGG